MGFIQRFRQEKRSPIWFIRTMFFDAILARQLVDAEQFVMMNGTIPAFRDDIRDKKVKFLS